MEYRKVSERALFRAGEDGYAGYRIPAVITLPGGKVLAFAEGRRNSLDDTGAIDIVEKVSTDGGKSFGELRVAVSGKEATAGNPSPVYDRETGKVVMVFNRNRADGPEHIILQGKAPRTVHVIESADGGESWTNEREITHQTKLPLWTWYAAGPCHALQLQSGRLLIPCNHAVLDPVKERSGGYISHVIFSDDHGENWRIGGEIEEFTNESTAVQLKDGKILLNMRTYPGKGCRTLASSRDEGISFTDIRLEKALPEPCCQGSMLNVLREDGDHILFTNPACPDDRRRLAIHESVDGGDTWTERFVFGDEPAAYSDLTELSEGRIGVLYETGAASAYEKIEWVILDCK